MKGAVVRLTEKTVRDYPNLREIGSKRNGTVYAVGAFGGKPCLFVRFPGVGAGGGVGREVKLNRDQVVVVRDPLSDAAVSGFEKEQRAVSAVAQEHAGPDKPKPSKVEHAIQSAFIAYVDSLLDDRPWLIYLFAAANGGMRLRTVAVEMEDEGVRPGVPDLLYPVPRGPYHGLCLEMKTADGRVRRTQKAWHRGLEAMGWHVVVPRSASDAQAELMRYEALELRLSAEERSAFVAAAIDLRREIAEQRAVRQDRRDSKRTGLSVTAIREARRRGLSASQGSVGSHLTKTNEGRDE